VGAILEEDKLGSGYPLVNGLGNLRCDLIISADRDQGWNMDLTQRTVQIKRISALSTLSQASDRRLELEYHAFVFTFETQLHRLGVSP